jgi:hypothetical protein
MIDTDKYEGHTPAPWMMGEYKGRPSIHAGDETFVRSIARGLNPSQTVDHRLLLDAPLLLEEVKRLRERIDEFGLAVTDMLPMWEPGDYDEMEINGKRKIVVDEDWWRWMATHIETLLYPIRYHVEGKRYNHDTCKWEGEEE